jgi:tetratricopeptide (TPR) repeat protein
MKPMDRMPTAAGLYILLVSVIGCHTGPVMQVVDQLRPGGSSAEESAIAERYLQADETVNMGIDVFEARVQRDPHNAGMRLGLARMYLADDQPAKALPHLEAAARIEPGFDAYFWLGVAQGATGQAGQERRSYQHALKYNPRDPRALTYLGHNRLEAGDLSEALRCYDLALSIKSDNSQALFNRAMIMGKQGRPKEARQAWRRYLEMFPSGTLAVEAVSQLNALGDFTYRNHPIGHRLVPLPQPKFETGTAVLTADYCTALQPLAETFNQFPDMQLHLVVYQKGQRKLAAARALALRECILGATASAAPDRLLVSWFDSAEVVPVGKKLQSLDFSVRLFTATQS